jgi:hypothetical protein
MYIGLGCADCGGQCEEGLGAIAYSSGIASPGYIFGTSGRAFILGGTKAATTQTVLYQRPGAKLPVQSPIPYSFFPKGYKRPVLVAPKPTVPRLSASTAIPISTSTGAAGGGSLIPGGAPLLPSPGGVEVGTLPDKPSFSLASLTGGMNPILLAAGLALFLYSEHSQRKRRS